MVAQGRSTECRQLAAPGMSSPASPVLPRSCPLASPSERARFAGPPRWLKDRLGMPSRSPPPSPYPQATLGRRQGGARRLHGPAPADSSARMAIIGKAPPQVLPERVENVAVAEEGLLPRLSIEARALYSRFHGFRAPRVHKCRSQESRSPSVNPVSFSTFTGCMSRPYGDVRDALCEGNFSRVGSTRGIILQSDGSRAVRGFGQQPLPRPAGRPPRRQPDVPVHQARTPLYLVLGGAAGQAGGLRAVIPVRGVREVAAGLLPRA